MEFLCSLPRCILRSETPSRSILFLCWMAETLGNLHALWTSGNQPQKKNQGGDPCPVSLTGLTWGGIESCVWSALETTKRYVTSSKGKLIIFQNSLSLAMLCPCSPLFLSSFLCSLCVPLTFVLFITLPCSWIFPLCAWSTLWIKEYRRRRICSYCGHLSSSALFFPSCPQVYYSQCFSYPVDAL